MNAIEIEDLSKKFRLYHERNQSLKSAIMRKKVSRFDEFWAFKDVSFSIPMGSTFGLVGSNGSGKSTLLKCLAKIYSPTSGSIQINGSMASLLEVGSGFHQELSGRENIYLNGSILGMSQKEIDRKLDEIIDFSGVEKFIDQPVKNYSSGMYVRLGFSVAISVQPDVLVVDEVLAVGDAEFQTKCLNKFKEYKTSGRTVIMVTHSMDSIRSMCDSAAWLNKGNLELVGDSQSVISAYENSYNS